MLVDRIARDRLRAARVNLVRPRSRPTALERFLEGLTADEPALPPSAGYPALARRLSRWVHDGLSQRSEAAWKLGLHLDERPPDLVLQLWLHATDDPTVSLPASLLEEGADEVFSFLRASDARRDLARQLTAVEPLLAERGIELRGDATEAAIAPDEVGPFLRETMPRARRAGRAGSPPRPMAAGAEADPPQPHRHEPAVLRPPLDAGARALRLEAGSRRRDAHRGGAARARAPEGAVRAGRRPLARRAAVRGRAGAALPRAPPRRGRESSTSSAPSPGSRRRSSASSSASWSSTRRCRSSSRASTSAASAPSPRRPRCASTSSPSRSAATGGCACSATSGSARSSPTTWGSGRRCRRSRCSLPSGRRGRRPARRSWSRRCPW